MERLKLAALFISRNIQIRMARKDSIIVHHTYERYNGGMIAAPDMVWDRVCDE
jgi:hypothetical protein